MTANQRKLNNILHSVGLVNNLTDKQVAEIFDSQFEFIYQTIRNQNIEHATPDELGDMKLSFLLRHIGKIYTDEDIIQKIHRRKSYLNKLKEDGRQTTSDNNREGERVD